METDHFSWSRLAYRLTMALLVTTILAGCAIPVKTGKSAGVLSAAAQSPQAAALKSLRGTVEVQAGGNWSPLPAGGEPFSLAAGQHVRTGDLSSAQISFADGSLVDLDANSELSIDELQTGSQNQPRQVTLTQVAGESQHTVVHAQATDSYYVVNTPGGTATAKGTQFSVWVLPNQTSYIIVTEGALEVLAAKVTVTVSAGQMTSFLPDHPPIPPLAHLSGEGTVTQIGETWTIAGLTFKARTDTFQIGTIHLGDVVHFEGHLLADGSRSLDLVILLQPSPTNSFRLQGAVEKITSTTWTVNGKAIKLTPQTRIEPGIVAGDLVWVEGLILASGDFEAERIFKAGEESGLPFEFVGPVQEKGTARWVIAGVPVSVNAKTVIGDKIEVGRLVRVAGRIQTDGTWLAVTIQLADEHQRQFEFTGEIESIAPWKVAGILFETGSWTQVDPGLKVGDRVRVSGTVEADGKWIAAEIRLITGLDERLVLIGPVLSVNPWVVSGVPFKTSPQTIIVGTITVGMVVRVEARLLADGTWEAIRIEPLQLFVWIPTCLNVTVVIVSVQGSLVQFQGWPRLTLPPDFKLDSRLVPNTTVAVRMCFNAAFIIQIISITVITVTPPPDEETEKVLICHKPGKKNGGKTMLLPRSALGGHLGHGDTLGACQ